MSEILFTVEGPAAAASPAKKKAKALRKNKRESVQKLLAVLRRVVSIDAAERLRGEKLEYTPFQVANSPAVKAAFTALIQRCENALKE